MSFTPAFAVALSTRTGHSERHLDVPSFTSCQSGTEFHHNFRTVTFYDTVVSLNPDFQWIRYQLNLHEVAIMLLQPCEWKTKKRITRSQVSAPPHGVKCSRPQHLARYAQPTAEIPVANSARLRPQCTTTTANWCMLPATLRRAGKNTCIHRTMSRKVPERSPVAHA